MTLSSCSIPSIAVWAPGSSAARYSCARQRAVEDLVDQRRLARAADAGDGRQHAERDADVDVLEVVLARALDDDVAARRLAGARAASGCCARCAGRRAVSEPLPSASSCCGVPWKITWPPCSPAPGPEIDDVVGGPDRLLVVLDDQHGVAEIAQPGQRREQRAVVALVQADRRLVEHVEHAGQVRADLRGQTDALPFAARQRGGAAAERQIADADVVQEMDAVADLAQNAVGDQRFAVGQLERVEDAHRFGRSAAPTYSEIVRPLTRTARLCGFSRSPLQRRAGAQRAIRLEVLLLEPAALLVAAPQVGNQPLEAGAERILLLGLALLRRLVAPPRAHRAEEQQVADLPRQPPERQVEVDVERAAQASRAPRERACGPPSPTARSRRPSATATRRAPAARDRSRRRRRAPGNRCTRRAAS